MGEDWGKEDWGKSSNSWSEEKKNDWSEEKKNDWGESKKNDWSSASGGGGGWGATKDSSWAKTTNRRDENSVDTSKWEEVEQCDDELHILSDHQKLKKWNTWDDVKFPADLIDILTDGKVAAFEKPTTIQAYVWPAAWAKKEDIIGVAKTGSGKTLAFLIPAFLKIKGLLSKDPDACNRESGPLACVIAPTRELCIQIYDESVKFGNPAGIATALAHGGDGNRRQQLSRFWYESPSVAVCTPGRMKDFLDKGDVKAGNVEYVVLDEADRMLDMGFEADIRAILEYFGKERQSMLFSATFPSDVKVLARKLCYADAVHIQIGSSDPLTGNSDIHQDVKFVNTEAEKKNAIYDIVGAHWDETTKWWKDGDFKYLVFSNTKRECQELEDWFNSYKIEASSLHGDKDQRQRERALNSLKDGSCKVLFATDVASRGLDIKGITMVINYSPPSSVEDYVHRIGRTGRAGVRGEALTFLLPDEYWKIPDIMTVMKKTGQEVPHELQAKAREAKWGGGGRGGW